MSAIKEPRFRFMGDFKYPYYEESRMADWKAQDVAHFVKSVGASPIWTEYAEKFLSDEIDGLTLQSLNADSFKKIGINNINARTLLEKIWNIHFRELRIEKKRLEDVMAPIKAIIDIKEKKKAKYLQEAKELQQEAKKLQEEAKKLQVQVDWNLGKAKDLEDMMAPSKVKIAPHITALEIIGKKIEAKDFNLGKAKDLVDTQLEEGLE